MSVILKTDYALICGITQVVDILGAVRAYDNRLAIHSEKSY
jgi:hypothetical protein